MARTFGDPYDIDIPLRTTWQEEIVFQDPSGNPVPINALKARGQLREVVEYDDLGNKVYGPSVLALSTEGLEPTLVIPDDTSGRLQINVPADTVASLSPSNLRRQVDYDIEFYKDSVSPIYVEPAVAGTITFTQRVGATA